MCDVELQQLLSIDWKLAFSIRIPGLLVVSGWFLAHWLTSRRDLANRRREARVKALEAAYMRVASTSNRDLAVSKEFREKIETFVSEMQLYATPQQIKLLGDFVNNHVTKGGTPTDELLMSMRDAVREELKLEKVVGTVWWLRLADPPSTPKPHISLAAKIRQKSMDRR